MPSGGWRRWASSASRRRARSGRACESLAGKTILVHAEQGFGDTLQFCRYVPLLAQRGATVVLGVHKPLENLVATLPGPFRLLKTGESIPYHDYHCPLLSLPFAFRTTLESIPAKVPYLASRPELVAQWRARLGARNRRRVGIAWSGNAAQVNDHNRSMPLDTMLQIAPAGLRLVSLQKEVRASDAAALRRPSVADYRDLLTDFEQTAALIDCMDVVVTVAPASPTWRARSESRSGSCCRTPRTGAG